MKILFLIRSLNRGGAETQLVHLAAGLARLGHETVVATFYPEWTMGKSLSEHGVRLISLDKKGRWDVAFFLHRLTRLVRTEKPDVLHAYMTTANVLAAFLKPLLPSPSLVWGVRATEVKVMRPDRLAALSLWLELRLGRRADQIIANSRAGMSRLIEQGMPEQRIAVVHNGIDSDYYTPSPELRSSTRSSWNLDDSDIVIGLPARLDPLKDHSAFLKAAKIVVNTYPNVRFVCAGGGDPVYAEELLRLSDELGLDQSVLWLGEVQDMRSVYATLDIAVLCSISESFPNALCEAMACGVPCIATNVGDCAQIVGDTGIMVRPGESMGLAEAILVMIQRIHVEHKLGIAARERIVSRYGLRRMVEETEKVLLQAVAKKGG